MCEVCDQVRLKPIRSATEASIAPIGIIPSRQ